MWLLIMSFLFVAPGQAGSAQVVRVHATSEACQADLFRTLLLAQQLLPSPGPGVNVIHKEACEPAGILR